MLVMVETRGADLSATIARERGERTFGGPSPPCSRAAGVRVK
jgi:hypothetical protein